MYYHYIYMTADIKGNFYIGRHSTKKLNDDYFGSGKWVIKQNKKNLQKRIISFAQDFEQLKKLEEYYLNQWIDFPKNKNFNNNSVGFGVGKYNIHNKPGYIEPMKGKIPHNKGNKHSLESRIKMSLASKGKSKTKQHAINISLAIKGKPSPHKGKKWGPYSEKRKNSLKEAWRKKKENNQCNF